MEIDLRSDTVTRPTAAMWEAMRRADLGDDVLGDEPTVAALERKIAQIMGKEAALFTPSGTMANQLAIRSATEPGDEIIGHRDSHIIHYETGAPAALSGCMIWGLDGPGGLITADDIHRSIRHPDVHYPRTRMVIVENTHNRGGGTVWPISQFREVAKAAHAHSLHVHVDGARLMNACVAGGYSPAEFAASADSVSICFSKGLGCPVGSALTGSAAQIAKARRFRKMFGGGMRQSGLLAAAAMYALDHHVARLAEDHANARRLAKGLDGLPGLRLQNPPDSVPTNMVFFHVDGSHGDAATFCTRLAERGIRMIDMDPTRVRAVTHLDVDVTAIDRAISEVRALCAAGAAGARR